MSDEDKRRMVAVLWQHRPYEAVDGNLYCKNRDCRPTFAKQDAAWNWAEHVADILSGCVGNQP